jgi:hypothetical protein
LLLTGLICIGTGMSLLLRRGVATASVALGAGAVTVAIALALSLPWKVVATDHLVTAFRPVITATVVTQARQDLRTTGAMTAELETRVIPDVASRLNISPQQLAAGLAQQAPAVATALARMPAYSATFTDLVNRLDRAVPDFRQTKRVPSLTFLDWLQVTGGALGVAAGGVALLARRRSEPSPVTIRTGQLVASGG